jgi:hypothetical protein
MVVNPHARMLAKVDTGSQLRRADVELGLYDRHQASDQKLEAAAKAAWSYSLLCARTYLNDHDAARELMDHSVQNASRYIARHPEAPPETLVARIKSVIRRRAKQLWTRRSRELPVGSMFDMESLLAGEPEAETSIFAN